MTTLHFTESTVTFANPERGYYVGVDLVNGGVPSGLWANGNSLAIALVQLDAYINAPLDAALLAALDHGFATARAAGIKVVLRFRYNSALAADASKARILGHIAQLAPVLLRNADVIAVMQAGFIGAWGEWHSSTNGLDNDTDRGDILNAILAALPSSRQVDVRTPMFKAAIYPGGPLTAGEAFLGTPRARVGHHNDCFLASPDDFGTYTSPVATWESYVAQDGQYTAIGGETCALDSPRSDCASAVTEMQTNHWSYLNQEYNQSVLSGWDAGGCGTEVRNRLGYRFAVQRFAYSQAAAPGGGLAIELDVANRGFAAPYNHRPVYVVLSSGATRRAILLAGIDARRWAAGTVTTIAATVAIPADLAAGTYTVALWLPDDAASLRDDVRYSIRLANDGVWNSATGLNVLASDLLIR